MFLGVFQISMSFKPHIEREVLEEELRNSGNVPRLILITFGMNKNTRNWWFVQSGRVHYCNLRNRAVFDPESNKWNATLQCCNSRPPISCRFNIKMTFDNPHWNRIGYPF